MTSLGHVLAARATGVQGAPRQRLDWLALGSIKSELFHSAQKFPFTTMGQRAQLSVMKTDEFK